MREPFAGRRRSRAIDQAEAGVAPTQPAPDVAAELGHVDRGAAGEGAGCGPAETVGETGVLTQRAQQAVQLAAMLDQAQDYARLSRATNTQRAYRADWADFSAWCAGHGQPALPATPQTVLLYLTDAAQRCKVSTLQRRLTTISQAHKAERHPSPTGDPAVRAVWAGIKRTKGTAQHGKTAAVTEDLRRMVRALPQTSTIGRRNRALLLLGFAGAFRRSELVGLDIADVVVTGDGLVVTLRRSKTDQEGAGRTVGIPYGSDPTTCPVRATTGWIAAAGLTAGPLFRSITRHGKVQGRLSDWAVAQVVKAAATGAGLDPTLYAGHSLRAGLATAAAQAGVSERAIMAQTGHKSLPMVRKYIRAGSLFQDNAAAKVGL